MPEEAAAPERPATFREVFASREYRYLFSATLLSWCGDYLAKAAVTALVFAQTRSVVLSAAAFALSYLPWVAGGPLLAAMAEHRPFRTVMVTSDLLRAGLMCLVALPGMPVPAMLALLFATALGNPPFEAARSAVLPQILTGDRYVVGLSLHSSTSQVAQLAGYLGGAALAPFYPRLALLLNAATFVVSAALIRYGIADRRPIGLPAQRRRLLAETADGFRVVFGTRVLRAIAVVVFASMLFSIVPEGLAAAWAAELAGSDSARGWTQGLIMVAKPLGVITGSLTVARLIRPDLRRRLVPPFVVLAPLALVPALADPGVWALVLMGMVCGAAIAGMLPTANGLFVQALPAGYRARAYGVMQGGMQVIQGSAVLVTGVLADRFSVPAVVGWWSLAGAVLLFVIVLRWPGGDEFAKAAAAARALERGAAGTGGAPPVVGPAPARVPPRQMAQTAMDGHRGVAGTMER